MNRALRRHQQAVARLRHIHIIWLSHPWHWRGDRPYQVCEDPERPWAWYPRRKPWQQVSRCTMRGEPKAWQKWTNLQPSRARQNHLLRGIRRGIDPETVPGWPDYRKPHQYYW